MFKLCRKVSLYEECPFLYSSAWYDWVTHCEVCFPIGIHWLVRWVRAFWLWTLRANARDALVAKAHATGWACGRQVGVEEGKREVIEELKQRLQAARDGEWVELPDGVGPEDVPSQ